MFLFRSVVPAAVLTLCLTADSSPLNGQAEGSAHLSSTDKSLQGLDGVVVQTVFTVDREAALAGPDRESVHTFVEGLLEDARVRSLAPGEASSRTAFLELEVGISTLMVGGNPFGWAYQLNLQVLQEVCVEGLPRPSGCSIVPTWGTGTAQPTIVAHDLTTALYGQVAEAVDRFRRDYREANPASG